MAEQHPKHLNEWLLSLEDGRRVALLRGGLWMLADAAFEAGLAASKAPEGAAELVSPAKAAKITSLIAQLRAAKTMARRDFLFDEIIGVWEQDAPQAVTPAAPSDAMVAVRLYKDPSKGDAVFRYGFNAGLDAMVHALAALKSVQPPAPESAAPSDAEALLTEMAKAPGAVIRSSRDMNPAEIVASRAAGKWITLRDGLGFAIMDEHARQVAEDEPVALKSVQPPVPSGPLTDEQLLEVHRAAIEHAERCNQGHSYGRAQALRAVIRAAQQGTGTATPARRTKEQAEAHIQDVCEEDIRGPVDQRGEKL